jgi:AmmeMemoRadiSam system protein A
MSSGCHGHSSNTSWEKEKIRALAKNLLHWFVQNPGTFTPGNFSSTLKLQIKNTLSTDYFDQMGGVFFTLYKNGALRGCMGNLSGSSPYRKSIPRQIHMAALEDPRFPAVSQSELGELCGEFTFLSPLRDANTWEDWTLGTHGIQITLDFSRAVFLPKVPIDHNWDKATTLQHLCRKAGLGPQAYLDPLAKFKIFEGETLDLGQL